MKRARYRLWWDRALGVWCLSKGMMRVVAFGGLNKREAVSKAADYVRKQAPSQLQIRTKLGRIESERTYVGDPVRYPG